jgi:hypothetical protein
MKRLSFVVLFVSAVIAAPGAQTPAEKLDAAMIAEIKDEGLRRSQIMDHISWLSDVYGPRLTGGPGIRQASDWALKTFAEWGLANAHRETFAFGKGWSLVRFSAQLIEPQIEPLIGFPARGRLAPAAPSLPTSSACRSTAMPTSRSAAAPAKERSC